MKTTISELKRLTEYDTAHLTTADQHPHEIKRGRHHADLYRDRDGWVFILNKSGGSEPEETGINLFALRRSVIWARSR